MTTPNGSTPPTRTDETTRETHLARLEAHARWLVRRGSIELALGSRDEAERKYLAHESLRWIIDRETGRHAIEELSG